MKKLLLTLLTALMSMPIFASVKIGDLYYELDDTELTASVTYQYYNDEYNYYGLDAVSVPETVTYDSKTYSVTSIGNSAFAGCSGLKTIEIPNSVTTIGDSAFNSCRGLTRVEIPNSVIEIRNMAFKSCSSLSSLTFEEGESPITLGYNIFDSFSSNGKGLFADCPLETLYLGRNYTVKDYNSSYPYDSYPHYYGYSPFAKITTLTEVTIGNNITSLPRFFLYSCFGLTSVTIPNSVTSIGENAFSRCSGLTSVEIPNSVTSIGSYAFSGCSGLTSVEIPNSVTSIGSGAFDGCSSLTSVEISDLTAWCNIQFHDETSNPLCYAGHLYLNGTEIKDLVIPNSVTEIGDRAFCGYSGLTSVEIPNSVTSIEAQAFYGCSGLTSVTIGNSVTSIGPSAFAGCRGLTSIEIPNSVTSIGGSAFYYCSGLTSVTIPNSVTSIGDYAFYYCSGLTSVTLSNSEIDFNSNVFQYCNLTSLTLECETPPGYYYTFRDYSKTAVLNIPENTYVKYLTTDWRNFKNICAYGENILTFTQSDGIFDYVYIENDGTAILSNFLNKDATSVSIPDRTVGNNDGDEKFYKVVGIGDGVFSVCTSLTQIKLPVSLEIIGSYTFSDCSGLTNIEIPNSVTSIGQSAFSGCIKLLSVEIPDGVTSIEDKTFNGCTKLSTVKIPDSVTTIGSYAFYGCSSLRRVTIPNSVTSIGDHTFYGCSTLTRVDIFDLEAWCKIVFEDFYANPLYYADRIYLNDREIAKLVIPNSVTSIGNYAFYGCSSLTSVEIPNSVTSIGESAFYDCSGLTSVEIPNSVTTIGDHAFTGCNSLTNVIFADGTEELTLVDNTFNAFNVYVGRNLSGSYSFPNVKTLTIGGFVTNIPANTYNKSSLASVTINPGAEVVIEDRAFRGCSNLTEIVLPEDIAEIGANAFSGTGLRNVTVPGGIIGDNAFANCNLYNIILGADVESIGEMAFDGSNDIMNVYATPTTPPAAQNNTFSYYEAQLWVPEEAVDTYYNNTRCWYRFNGKPLVCPENLIVEGPATFSGIPGETLQLSATITPANVTLDRVLWRSTNPAVATVDNNGLVTIHNFQSSDEAMARAVEEGFCQIIATTLYEESPVAVVNIEVKEDSSSIEYINSEDMSAGSSATYNQNDIYTLQGVCLKRQASQSEIDALSPGIYIIDGKKVIVK